jgi:hypothetical protein
MDRRVVEAIPLNLPELSAKPALHKTSFAQNQLCTKPALHKTSFAQNQLCLKPLKTVTATD